MTCFRSHDQALGRQLGLSRRPLADPRNQSPGVAKEDAVALNKTGGPKADTLKTHIGFRLSADVVTSLKASGPGYNVRVEEALRAAEFGATKKLRAAKR
jgi:uncharacterized protein (DUF4415 family)